MKYSILVSLLMVFTGAVASADEVKMSCKYGEDPGGTPTRLYTRISLDPADFYSPVRTIQFCERAEGKGTYLLVGEELIKNFQVLNPPIGVETGTTDDGLTYYLLDDSSFAQKGLALLVSKDNSLIKVYRNQDLVDVLTLTQQAR